MLTVRAPATSANLGPGYDCLSLALDVANIVEAWPADDGVTVEVVGEGAEHLPADADNEVYRALSVVYARHGTPPPALRMRCQNLIPPSRGLGSSSAARASGLMLGNRLLGDPYSMEQLFEIGAQLEGHPDNIAACLFGGVQVCVTGRNGLEHLQVPVAFPLATTVYIPDFPMDTHAARGLLPTAVSIETAVYNISRSSLFVAALAAGRTDLLRTATEDAIHQPPRSTIFPALPVLIAAALEAGAYGAFLSGAGSSVMALAAPEDTERVGAAMDAAARGTGVPGRVLQAGISTAGATVEGTFNRPAHLADLATMWSLIRGMEGTSVRTKTGTLFTVDQVTDMSVTVTPKSTGHSRTIERERFEKAYGLASAGASISPSDVQRLRISRFNSAYVAAIVNEVVRSTLGEK